MVTPIQFHSEQCEQHKSHGIWSAQFWFGPVLPSLRSHSQVYLGGVACLNSYVISRRGLKLTVSVYLLLCGQLLPLVAMCGYYSFKYSKIRNALYSIHLFHTTFKTRREQPDQNSGRAKNPDMNRVLSLSSTVIGLQD